MHDDDPPPQRYGFKPREFERANPPAGSPPPAPPTAGTTPNTPGERIDVKELHRMAGTPGPILNRPASNVRNEVHAILEQNVADATAAGLNDVAPRPRRRSRRKRDFWIVLTAGDLVLAFLAGYAALTRNPVLFVYAIAGMGCFSAALTWVMWFVMDDY